MDRYNVRGPDGTWLGRDGKPLNLEHKIDIESIGSGGWMIRGCNCGFRTHDDSLLVMHIAANIGGPEFRPGSGWLALLNTPEGKDHEMPKDEEMTPYRGSGKRMLSRDDEIEMFVPGTEDLSKKGFIGYREVEPHWKRAIVCVSDVYKSFGTNFLVQPKDSGEFIALKYADEGKTWRRLEDAKPIWAPELVDILRKLCTELGVSFSDSDPRKSADSALEKARWFRKPGTARETELQRGLGRIGDALLRGRGLPPNDPEAIIAEIRAIQQERDDAHRELARARNIVNRLAGCLGIGDWNHDGDELVAKAGQWQSFTQWLKAAVVGAQRKADSFEFGDTKNRVTWKEVHQQLRLVYDQLTATVGKDNPRSADDE